jgi:Lrp/AsnC family transcriptional regulator, leucine-responsive regulatory protein
MPKRSKKQIDQDEKKVLAELKKNSHASIDKISKICGFSRQKVWRLIKRLEKDRIIWGYTAIVDEEKIDQKHYVLLLKRKITAYDEKIVDALLSRRFEDTVAKLGITIETSSYIHGDYDWLTTFTAPDIRYAKKFCELLNSNYPDMFEKICLMETLFDIKKQHIFNPDTKRLKELL